MHDPNCIFCKIIKKEIPAEIVYENDDFICFLDIGPNNLGHSLLLPKAHYENIYSLPKDILEKFGGEIQKLSIAIKKAVKADGINVILNNDPAAGQIIFHSHTHIIPRFNNDGFKWWPKIGYKDGEIEKIGKKIRGSISS
jgi:histidine triad (HIT) family protein